MFVEMLDLLRCPRPHEDSWLVAASDETVARHVVRGTLGCPVCGAEYPIVGGVAVFGAAPTAREPEREPVAADDALRIAAFLDLASPGGTIVLGGAWQRVARDVASLAGVRVLLLDPPEPVVAVDGVSAVRGGGGLPVARAAVRGAALDARTAEAERLTAATLALAPRARLVAPVAAPLPDGVTELARDGRLWIAERSADAAIRPVRLERRAPRDR